MRCPALNDLPPPPPGKTGWPWTEESPAFPATQPNGEAWPKIGIVTPSYNQAEHLEETIRSVLLQGYPNLDYIIIDGGSTDQSPAIIRKYAPWLSYWVSEPDKGCSDASAKGLARTDAHLLGVMNTDDFFASGAFAKLLALRSAQPQNVLWGGAGPEVDSAGKQIDAGLPFQHDAKAIGNWWAAIWFSAVACLFDGPAYRAVGGFDPRFRHANDVDLWIRLGKVGTFAFTPETIAYVHYNPGSISRRDEQSNYLALITSNYLHGNSDLARTIMVRYFRKWAKALNTNQPLPPEAAEEILAMAAPGVLTRALAQRISRPIRHSFSRLFPQ